MFVNKILESQKFQTVFYENQSLLRTRDPMYRYSFRRLLDKPHDVELTKYVNKSKMEVSEEQYRKDCLEEGEQEYRKDFQEEDTEILQLFEKVYQIALLQILKSPYQGI